MKPTLFTKGNAMLTFLAIVAVVAVPYFLDVYFSRPSESKNTPREE